MLGNCKIIVDKWLDVVLDPKSCANRVVDTVTDICYNGAASFLEAAGSVCKYNYQQLREHNRRERAELSTRPKDYLDTNT
jgi:hypothetical protein